MLVALPGRARAAVDWLTFRGTCAVDREQLAQRIEREVAGARSAGLSLVLELYAGTPVRGQLALRQGTRDLGTKQVEAASCAAALEVLVAIGALALSSFPAPDAEPSGATPAAASIVPTSTVAALPQAQRTFARQDQAGDPARRAPGAPSWRVLAGAGVALGASSPTTLLVTGGAAVSLGPGELRLLGRYGVPATAEEVEASARSVRHDFGAAAMDYCYGLDRARWLSLCGGLELVTRRERRVESGAQGRVESTRRAPLLGPSAGLLLVLRRVAAQPQLELAALVPVWGAPPGFGFRASLGGGLPF
jgi:hypothetical protein